NRDISNHYFPASPHFLMKAENYLKKKKFTYYRSNGWFDISKAWFFNWMVEKGEESLRKAAKNGVLFGRSVLLFRLSKTSLLTQKNKKILEYWINENYYFGKKSKELLDDALLRFGIKRRKLVKGRIIGKVKFVGVPQADRVGLFIKKICEKKEYDEFDFIYYLVDASSLKEDGEFEFDNLGEGEYVLGFLWNEFKGEKVRVIGSKPIKITPDIRSVYIKNLIIEKI
ncbi:MAG: hypothetical protein DRI36_05560, partial [Caldiserica bacterium]